jgi:hypothetical protein
LATPFTIEVLSTKGIKSSKGFWQQFQLTSYLSIRHNGYQFNKMLQKYGYNWSCGWFRIRDLTVKGGDDE